MPGNLESIKKQVLFMDTKDNLDKEKVLKLRTSSRTFRKSQSTTTAPD